MAPESPLAISVRTRLNAIAQSEQFATELIFVRYAQECFLLRLSRSEYRQTLTLKGGLLLTAITDRFGRGTRDIDFLAATQNSTEAYEKCIRAIASVEVDADGITFNTEDLVITQIMLHDEEPGLRATFLAYLGNARIRMQIDTGYGDDVLLPLEEFVYPNLLEGSPKIVLRAYSTESIIAEKFEAIASLGEINTRYKDYDDVARLAASKSFGASALYAAVNLTFTNRDTDIASTLIAVSAERATSAREQQWSSYVGKVNSRSATATFGETLKILRTFWSGIAAFANDGVERTWDGKWRVVQ